MPHIACRIADVDGGREDAGAGDGKKKIAPCGAISSDAVLR
jgi:hypothetical protein